MRFASIAVLLGLSALGLSPSARQDEDLDDQELEEIEGLAPFTAYRLAERRRLEEEIEGAWILRTFETPAQRFDTRFVEGFVLFHEGYMTLVIQSQEETEGFLSLPHTRFNIQAGVFRYRFSEQLMLQTASIMGFANPGLEDDLFLERFNAPREYILNLDEGELRLNHPQGHWYVFQRMDRGEFPEEVIRELERSRMGFDTRSPFEDR